MLNRENLVILAKRVAGATPNAPVAYSFEGNNYSYSDLNDTLRKELNEYAGTYSLYRENKNLIFSLIEETIDDVLPKKVMDAYNQFAEVKTFAQGDRAVFVQKITNYARKRAKQFITKVGAAGIYEVFKLDGKSYEVKTNVYGGAAQIGLEEFLDGRVDFATVLDIVMEGLDEAILKEIANAMIAAVDSLQSANKASVTGFVETEMDRLISIAEAYGPATIYCTREFAAKMVPADGWVSDNMKDQRWNVGYLATYKGTRVVILPQSFEDETNTTKVIDPSFAFIFPGGGNKPVQIAFEGNAIVDEYENADRSREVQVYKKVGVAATFTNDICVYRDTSLTK